MSEYYWNTGWSSTNPSHFWDYFYYEDMFSFYDNAIMVGAAYAKPDAPETIREIVMKACCAEDYLSTHLLIVMWTCSGITLYCQLNRSICKVVALQ